MPPIDQTQLEAEKEGSQDEVDCGNQTARVQNRVKKNEKWIWRTNKDYPTHHIRTVGFMLLAMQNLECTLFLRFAEKNILPQLLQQSAFLFKGSRDLLLYFISSHTFVTVFLTLVTC